MSVYIRTHIYNDLRAVLVKLVCYSTEMIAPLSSYHRQPPEALLHAGFIETAEWCLFPLFFCFYDDDASRITLCSKRLKHHHKFDDLIFSVQKYLLYHPAHSSSHALFLPSILLCFCTASKHSPRKHMTFTSP